MYIKQIVSTAGTLLNKQNVVTYIQEGKVTGNALEEVEKLTSLTNLVISELAVSGFYVVKTERVNGHNGKIAYTSLSIQPIKIIKVTDDEGSEYPFKATCEHLITDNNVTQITYAYAIYNEGLESQITFDDYRLSEVVLAMGVCAEYLLMLNDFDGAVGWHDKYVESLEKLRRLKSVNIKQRSFI